MAIDKETVATVAAATLAVCAATLTGLTIRREVFPPARTLTEPVDTVENWPSFASAGHRIGPDRPEVTVVVFSDYQCPFCSILERQLSSLRRKYPDELSIIWRHFPLEGNELASLASRAAVCAAEQGSFEATHRMLFQVADSLHERSWSMIAADGGVKDTAAFVDCFRSERSALTVERDVAAGRSLRVVATPTFLVNGYMYSGVPRDLIHIVRREVKLRTRGHVQGGRASLNSSDGAGQRRDARRDGNRH